MIGNVNAKIDKLTKGEKTRQLILDRAALLFADKGYGAVSMDTIARSSGLTKGALYTHYSGKQEIYIEALIQYMNTRTAAGLAIEESGDARADLVDYLQWLVELFQTDKTYRLLLVRLLIEADKKTLSVFSKRSFGSPVERLKHLIHAFNPEIDALEFVYTIVSVVALDPDIKKTAVNFGRKSVKARSNAKLTAHLMALLEQR